MSVSNYSPEIIAEQIRMLLKNQRLIVLSTSFISLVMYFPLRGAAEHWILIAWIGSIQVTNIARVLVMARFRPQQMHVDALLKWKPALIFNALLSGTLWGLAPPLFIPGGPPGLVLLLCCVFISMSAGLIAPGLSIRTAVMSFTLPVVLSLCIVIFMLPDLTLSYLPPILSVYVIIVYFTSGHVERTVLESIKIRFEKESLLRALGEQKQEAERANLAKSKFLAAASHDLRQPLHALGLYLDTMQYELNTDKQKEFSSKMETAIDALKDLFERLLDISKLDAGIIEPSLTDSRVGEIFERLEVRFSPLAKAKQLDIQFKHHDETFYSDQLLIERILDNLIGNAIRYTAKGSIRVQALTKDGYVEISVSDTGPGIPEHEQENIFNEFHQLHNPERDRTKGLGLGLSIVRRLCDLLNHKLELFSSVAEGTRFCLHVPASTADLIAAQPNETDRASWDIRNSRVMVIDDEVDIQDAMRQLLLKWGCEVSSVSSIGDALEKVQSGFIPDLIIADYRLRDSETGIAAIQAVSNIANHTIPGILITGDTAPERLQEASQSGFKLLHKPVNAGQLRMVANHLLMQHLRLAKV